MFNTTVATSSAGKDLALFTRDHQWALPLHSEEYKKWGGANAKRVLERIVTIQLAHLADGRVSDSNKMAIIEWITDPLFRDDHNVPVLSFRGYCQLLDVEVFSMISTIITAFRGTVDRLFGAGAAAKIVAAADDRIPNTFCVEEVD